LSSIERYVPYKVVESILHSPESPTLKGERRKLTVLVSDLRGFCKIAESRQPEEVVTFLNRCCEVMSDVIERHGGTLDKFVGDGMMATFGSPNDDPYQEERAVKAALELQEKISELSGKCEKENWPAINVGIGVHSGYAVVGSMGSSRHLEYTAIGETVNTAYYLESATKQFRANILISQYTYNAIRGQFNVKHRVGDCCFGKGVFARSLIQKGEEILRFAGPLISLEEAIAKGARQCDMLQIAPRLYVDIGPPGVLVNHSCAPNAGIRDNVRLIAIADIIAGEEIFYDYSTTMNEDHWTLACRCGSTLCRGNVGDFKHLPLRTRQRYLRLGIVQAYLARQFVHLVSNKPECRKLQSETGAAAR
jgi:class 3 adenylate cyclase